MKDLCSRDKHRVSSPASLPAAQSMRRSIDGRERIRELLEPSQPEAVPLCIGRTDAPCELAAARVAHEVTGEPLAAAAGATPTPSEVPSSVFEVLRSAGQPLDSAVRSDMESRLGHGLSAVRVHAGELAARSARDINAQAYTVGDDIVLGASPDSQTSSRSLLVHELFHVLQPRGAEAHVLRRQTAAATTTTQAQQPASLSVGFTKGFIITPDIPINDSYLNSMQWAINETLQLGAFTSVNNIEDLIDGLIKDADIYKHNKIKRLIIVAHGTTKGHIRTSKEGHIEDLSAEKIDLIAKTDNRRQELSKVMAPGAVVEIWGCYIASSTVGMSLSKLFSSDVYATTQEVGPAIRAFRIQLRDRNTGELIRENGRPVWRDVENSSEVTTDLDRSAFWEYLRKIYSETVVMGLGVGIKKMPDIKFSNVEYMIMREIFNDNNGSIPRVAVRKFIRENNDSDWIFPIDTSESGLTLNKEWVMIWNVFDSNEEPKLSPLSPRGTSPQQ